MRLIHNELVRKRNTKSIIIAEAVACFLIAMLMSLVELNRPLWLPNVILGLAFFVVGSLFKENIDKGTNNKITLLGLSLAYIASIMVLGDTNFEGNSVNGGVIGYVFYIIFSITAICLFALTLKQYPKANLKFLVYTGKRSMSYYVMHWPIIYLTFQLLRRYLNGYPLYFTVLLIVFLICIALDYLLHKLNMELLLGERKSVKSV